MPKNRGSLLFSAHSLQAYVDCERRFELSYLEELKWPAVESEPLLEGERHMADGRRFHEMVHRDALGIAVSAPGGEADEDIARWWRNYQTHRPANVPGERFAEKTLVGSISGATLVATCDLIVLDGDGDGRIFDWKTWRKRNSREWLRGRMQTRVYPYLLVTAGAALARGKAVAPEDVEMVYWYADFPEDGEEVFSYSEEQFREDQAYLTGLVKEIKAREAGAFELTTNEKQCAFCAYRSFCDRGDVAGRSDDDESEKEEDRPSPLTGNLDDYEAVAF